MLRLFFMLIIGVALLPVVQAQESTPEPYADAITFSASPEVVKPEEKVTLTWEVRPRGVLRRADHVVIEMSHPVTYAPVEFDSLPLSGTLEVTIPDEYYDVANFWLYFRDKNGSDLRLESGWLVNARTEVVVDDDVDILFFTATPEMIDRGGSVTLNWEVTHRDTILLSYLGLDNIYKFEELPAKGSITKTVPDVFTSTFTYFIGGEGTLGASVTVQIRCPFETFVAAACPLTQETITMTYQPFEHGTMYRYGDTIFILYDAYNPEYPYSGIYRSFGTRPITPVAIAESPPEGLFLPAPEFAEIWLNETNIRESLGWSTGDSATYTTVRETARETAGKYPYIAEYFYRPDGKLIHTEGNPVYWRVILD